MLAYVVFVEMELCLRACSVGGKEGTGERARALGGGGWRRRRRKRVTEGRDSENTLKTMRVLE